MNKQLYEALQEAQYALAVVRECLLDIEPHTLNQMLEDDPDLSNCFRETVSVSRDFVGD